MSLINNLIARRFRIRNHRQKACVKLKEPIANNTSVLLDDGLNSHNLTMRSDCSHQEAIAQIENNLRGKSLPTDRTAEEPFQVGQHGVV